MFCRLPLGARIAPIRDAERRGTWLPFAYHRCLYTRGLRRSDARRDFGDYCRPIRDRLVCRFPIACIELWRYMAYGCWRL